MKKILALLLTFLTFTSCIQTYKSDDIHRSDDIFLVISKEKRNTKYKYLYRTEQYTTSATEKSGFIYLNDYIFISNENYELGDTIKFIRYASNEK